MSFSRYWPVVFLPFIACAHGSAIEQARALPTPRQLEDHCRNIIGAPRVVEITDGVYAALGYDLANTMLIHTPAGNVIVDPGMSKERAQAAKDALLARAPGKIAAIIYTHSHIDHVGGAAVWAEDETDIWATEAFRDHFLKQYALFQRAELRRGAAQFGEHAGSEALQCSSLGRQVDLDAARNSGARMPTRTFAGATTLEVGGVRIELHEAHGETHDQLFVWLPAKKALLPGDNYYHAFPNLYTIRGTSARPVDAWIQSLDRMRALQPEFLVPSHTRPVTGAAEIAATLTDYRDAIQWVRDETVRGANRGESMDTLAESIRLPSHLANKPFLAELYGQLDWSVRGIYTSNLGWFDERPETLYPMAPTEAARREVALMGGEQRVLAQIDDALTRRDFRWAAHLLAKLRDSALRGLDTKERAAKTLAGLAGETSNTNGRGYMLEMLHRLDNGYQGGMKPNFEDRLLAAIPVETFFNVMAVRLLPEKSGGVHERLTVAFKDSGKQFHITVRNGVAEIVEGIPLPGTPEPVATLVTDEMTWRKLALKIDSPALAVAAGRLKIEGGLSDTLAFLGRFDQEL